jgi:hypothetical protein
VLPSIPNALSVESAFRRTVKRLATVRKRINASAAKEMKADDYEAAQKWMEMGRSVADFAGRLDAFVAEWKRLVKATRIVARSDTGKGPGGPGLVTAIKRTPVWKFCEPALRVLAARGCASSLTDIVDDLGKDATLTLTATDITASSAHGIPRWHKTMKQAYKHCQREGWIEKRRDGLWKITPKGASVVTAKENCNGATP